MTDNEERTRLFLLRRAENKVGRRLRALRLQAGLTAQQVGDAAGISGATVSRIELGRTAQPAHSVLERLAGVYGFSSVDTLLGERDGSGAGGYGPPPLPVYRWGACGDPRGHASPPDPDRLEYAPLGHALLIGPRGFGVEVRGSSMIHRRIHWGDVVWCNPDRPPRVGGVVLARCWAEDGQEVGMVVKVLTADGTLSSATGKGQVAVPCARFDVIAPVVLVSPKPYPPADRYPPTPHQGRHSVPRGPHGKPRTR